MIEWIKDNQLTISAVLLLPASVLTWVRLRERLWSLTSRRRQAMRKLFQDGRWKKAARLDFHFAMHDAFGRNLEQVELAYIESRRDPVRLISDIFEAAGWVKFAGVDAGYVDARKPWAQKWLPFPIVTSLSMVIASLSVPGGAAFTLASWVQGGPIAGIIVGILCLQAVFLFGLVSFMADAARKVLSPDRHPPATPWPTKSNSKPKAKGPSGRHRKVTDGATTETPIPMSAISHNGHDATSAP